MAGGKIFINYRREDSRGEARALFDRLSARFPRQVFIDVSTLALGVDFVRAIEDEVGTCDVSIVVIGKRWLTATDASGRRRIDDPQDFVRLEIATALKRNIPVIPALVGGAAMPETADLPADLQVLTRRHALYLTDQGWDDDVNRLIRAIEPILTKKKEQGPGRRLWPWLAVAGSLACVLLLVKVLWLSKPKPLDEGVQTQSKVEKPEVKPDEEKKPAKPDEGKKPPKSKPGTFDPKSLSGLWKLMNAQAGMPGNGYDFMMYPTFEFSSIYQGSPVYPKGTWQFRSISKSLHFAADGLPRPEFTCDLTPADTHLRKYSGDCTTFDLHHSWNWELVRSGSDPATGDAGRRALPSPVGLWHAAQIATGGGKKTGEDVRLNADGKLEILGPGQSSHGSGTWELHPGKSYLDLACANSSGRQFSCDLSPRDNTFLGRCKFADGGGNWTWELTQ